jgi:hypothetical protein
MKSLGIKKTGGYMVKPQKQYTSKEKNILDIFMISYKMIIVIVK